LCLQRNFEERRRQVLPELMRKNASGSCLEIVQEGVILEDNWLADERAKGGQGHLAFMEVKGLC